MLSKYSIYGGGRWREIDIETGRVAGWAGSKFVYTKRGNLIVLKPKSVLRGLKDLASGHISTVKDGFQLSQLKKKNKPKKSPKQIKCKCYYQHNHVFAAANDKILQANIANASIQCNIVPVHKTLNKLNIKESVDKDVKSVESVETTISDNIARAITISESDVETFRSYIVHSTKNIFNVDLFMYDANDDYKRSVFYKITPIVKVQRHPIIDSLVRQKQFKIKLTSAEMRNETKTLSKNNYCEPKIKVIDHVDNSDTDISKEREIVKHKKVVIEHQRLDNVNKELIVENKGKRKAAEVIDQAKRSKLNNSDSLKENNDTVQTDKFGKPINKVVLVKKWTVKNKNSRKRPTNEFSLLEDEAIVDWIVKNKKGNLVNGNRMWKEMEPQHLNVTGQYRSWHSLRNRYLRHLLPALGSLSLTPSQIIDLRAAAATGELKANKMNKNNSIYRTEPVRSAWNARPQKLKHSDDELFTPRRNSNLVSPSRSKLPTYSEITRRFAEKHRSTPNSEEDVTNNKVKPRDNNQTNKQPRVSLKIIRVDSNEQGSLRVVNIDDKQDQKNEEKSVRKSREKSSRFASSRGESYGVEKKNRRGRKGNETGTDEEIKNNVNKKFENNLGSADRSGLNNKHENRRNKDDSDSEQRNEKKGQEIRSSRRLRHEKSGVEDTLRQNKSKTELNPEQKNQKQGTKTLENSASRIKSPEKSLTERSIGRRKNGRFIARKRDKEISSVDKKDLRQLRSKSDSDSEPEKKKKDDNGRSSARNMDKELSSVDRKNLRQLRNKNNSDSEPEKKKKDDNGRSSARNMDKEISSVDRKNLRQLGNKNDSDSEPEKKKKDENGRSSARNMDKEISSVDRKNLRQLRNKNDSNSEPENKKRDDNGRSSARNRDKDISRVDKKNPRQLRNNNDSDSEPENKKRDDNRRSSARNRDKDISRVDKKNPRQLRNNNDSDSEPENKKRDDNGRSSARNRDKEISRVDKKNPRQLRNKNDSDSEPENKKKDDNGRTSRNRDKSGKSDDTYTRSKKRDKSDTDNKENGADNKMYLRQYKYTSGAKMENAKTTQKRENGNISKNRKDIHSKSVKVDRSKRKYEEILDSVSENDREKKNKRDRRSSGSDSDFVKTSKKATKRSRSVEQSDDSDFSVNTSHMSMTSKSDFDSSNDKDKKRLTRQSHRVESGSRDIVFEISDNDEAYASRSDTDVKNSGKRNLRKLFNHRAL